VSLLEYVRLFVLVVTMGIGVPLLGDASLIAAGNLAGEGWQFCGMYVGLSYFLGAEIAERIGDAGIKAVIGVLVVVAIGLGIEAAVVKWRERRESETSRERR
jgi:membrane protein DedA with SNARE-associated domain